MRVACGGGRGLGRAGSARNRGRGPPERGAGVKRRRSVRAASGSPGCDQLDASGGLWDGRKVVVFAANDKAEARDAKAVALRVVAKGIHFVIGPYNSSVGLANLPLYRRNTSCRCG